MSPTVSVLMTIYHGTTTAELERSLDCIAAQTRAPDEFLVVVDGPVSRQVDQVLMERMGQLNLRVERLPENVGSGRASARGLELATCEFVARHDSDDVSLPHRLERQLAAITAHNLDLVGAAMLEFRGDPDNVLGVRRNPSSPTEIARYLRINNPINNPTAVFRRDLALQVGGYADLRYMQDYDLFARMIAAGARARNLEEPLVLFNAGDGMLSRRSGRQMLRWEWQLQRRLLRYGTIGPVGFVRNLVARSAFRLIPSRLIGPVYARLFRHARAESR